MAPLWALVVSFPLFWIFGQLGWLYFEEWQHALRGAVAVMFLVTATGHWGRRRQDLIRMVPPALPKPDWIVTLTGWLEIAGAVFILFPVSSQAASLCLATLLVLMFPANIRAARLKLTIGGKPTPKLFVRTLLQLVFLAAVLLTNYNTAP